MWNAYYDNRNYLKEQDRSTIRVMTVQSRNVTKANLFCQIWFEGIADPVISEVYEYRPVWYPDAPTEATNTMVIFVSCLNPLVDQGLIPLSVSIVANACDVPSNKFDVIYKLPENGKKKTVAVCAKLHDFRDDLSMMLIEWVESLILLGADRVVINVATVHPNMMNVLKFYEKTGKIDVEMMSLPNASTGLLLDEMIAINDCFYKNIYKFDLIISLDIDELLVPLKPEDRSWKDLLNKVMPRGIPINSISPVNFEVRMVFFNLDNNHHGEIQPEVPKNLLFLQHIYRAAKLSPEGSGAKSFMRTDDVIIIHIHRALQCVDFCNIYDINDEDARVQHYRNGCGSGHSIEECNDFRNHTVRDTALWRYKDDIMKNVDETVKATKTDSNHVFSKH